MPTNHIDVAAFTASLIALASATALRPHVINRLKIDTMPSIFGLRLNEVMQPANADYALTCECERL
jgi:hypothetical protein